MTTSGSNRTYRQTAQDSYGGSQGQEASAPRDQADALDELSGRMLSRLSQTIEGDIIPRLMLAFETSGAQKAAVPELSDRLGASVDEFVRLLLAHDAPVAASYVSALRSEGVPLSALYLDLLTPAARRLGAMWEEDECTFTDVTVGVCRMHQVLLEFSRCFDAARGSRDPGRNILVVPVPGEQHTFGLFMVIEFLRKAGFNCFTGTPTTRRDLEKLLREHEFDVIGFSVSENRYVEQTGRLIARARSVCPDAMILVGGRVFLDEPDLVQSVGADHMASDGHEAVSTIQRFCPGTKGTAGE